MVTRRAVVHGVVQGVGFRYTLAVEARRAGVTGWVRNRPDGTVEAVVHGDDAAVAAVLDWARHGPPEASVDRVDVTDAEPPDGDAFTVER